MDSVIPTIDELIVRLEKKGYEEESLKLAHIKESMLGLEEMKKHYDSVRQEHAKRFKPQTGNKPKQVYPPSKEKFKVPGEEVQELISPPGSMGVQELPQERAQKIVEYLKKLPPTERKIVERFFKGDRFGPGELPRKPGELLAQPIKIASYLFDVSQSLDAKGYDMLSHRVMKVAADMVKRMPGDMKETHEIPSIERIYEKSGSVNDFEENIEKFKKVCDNISSIIDLFLKTYKSKGTELEAKEAITLVSKSDKLIGNKIDELIKKIER